MLQNNKWWTLYSLSVILGTAFCSYYRIIFNCTNSLPERLFFVKVNDKDLKVNDFVVAYSKNLPNMQDNVQLIKHVAGVAGSSIKRYGTSLYVDDKFWCTVNEQRVKWGVIHPVDKLIVPKDCYFVLGTSSNSFDSRYKEFGLLCKNQILGKAYALF
jgi:signal peptidase I